MRIQTKILFVVFAFVLIAGMSLVAAENESQNDKKDAARDRARVHIDDNIKQMMNEAKNATRNYGQCVSLSAKIRNNCTNLIKSQAKTCNEDARNQTDAKNATKECDSIRKADINQCKKGFKDAKKECTKIRHGIFDEWMHNWD